MDKKKKNGTALAKPESAGLIIPSSGPLVGQENIDKEDILLPRMRLLQPMSEEVVSNEYKAGSFVNSLTGENTDFLDVLMFYFFKSRVMFGANLGEDIQCMSLDGKRTLDGKICDGCPESSWGAEKGQSPKCDVVYNFPCLVMNSQSPTIPVILSLKRTSISQAKQLISTVKLAHMQWWSIIYHVTSELKKNEKGQFYVFKVLRQMPATAEQQDIAQKYYNELSGKTIRVQEDQKDDFRGQSAQD